MNVEITGRHIEITDAIKDYIQKRVAKFPKLVGGLCDFHFVLTVEKHRQIAEVNLTSKLGNFTATDESKDLYGSVGTVLDKVEKQVRRSKDRRKGKSRTNEKQELVELMRSSITDVGRAEDLSANPAIIEMQMNARPMALEEALHELNTSGGSFVVFINADSELTNVLYRRNDGNFGLIHP
ncbi:MAG: ribosome-associated translation inhibitor RaiA [Acidobacteria bacterium]|nr:ribosome-associated translation inhibitor RaiA [Acidobacteriota bacterium]